MHPTTFRKAIMQAYLAGAAFIIESESNEYPSKEEVKDWFYNEYGLHDSEEECDCCEEE